MYKLHIYFKFKLACVVHYRLIRYYAPGIQARLERTTGLQPPFRDTENIFEPVELNQMVQVLSIAPCAAFISFIFLIFELIFKRFKWLLKKILKSPCNQKEKIKKLKKIQISAARGK